MVNYKHMTLISLYIDYFKRNEIPIDVIYYDKYDIDEDIPAAHVYKYTSVVDRKLSKVKKLLKYWNFRKFVFKECNLKEYDLVIVWKTETAFLFLDHFLFTRKKFILNVRDYLWENNPIFKLVMSWLVRKAEFTTISSEGFKRFLPKNDYVIIHSLNESLLNNCSYRSAMRSKNEPIRIGFIGYVRFYDTDKQLLRALANDSRYIVQFFGEGSQELEKYCQTNNIHNVEFMYGFKVEETCKLLEKIDVINNLYGKGEIALDTAISIKYYYALYLRVPILVFKETYMEEVSLEAGIGYATGLRFDNLANDFYEWYHSTSIEKISANCNIRINSIKRDQKIFKRTIDNLIKGEFGNKFINMGD